MRHCSHASHAVQKWLRADLPKPCKYPLCCTYQAVDICRLHLQQQAAQKVTDPRSLGASPCHLPLKSAALSTQPQAPSGASFLIASCLTARSCLLQVVLNARYPLRSEPASEKSRRAAGRVQDRACLGKGVNGEGYKLQRNRTAPPQLQSVCRKTNPY